MTDEKPKRKNPARSKTLWFNAIVAGLGALETAAPGTIPPGPALVAISVIGAVLRTMTTAPVR
jgi:hypothetical protein